MATYAELHNIMTDNVVGAQALREKIGIACLIAADIIASGDDTSDPPWSTGGHEQRVKWVNLLLASTGEMTRRTFGMVIAANASAGQSAILSATDATIQGAVNAVIDTLAANL